MDEHLTGLIGQGGNGMPLASWRERCASQFRKFGLPTPRDENWKYTSTRMLQPFRYQKTLEQASAIAPEDLQAYAVPGMDCYRMTFVDGHFVPGLSCIDQLPAGCKLAAISATELPAWANALLEQAPKERDSGFFQLNGALFDDGLLMHLEPDAKLDRPLQILSVSSTPGSEEGNPGISNIRHLIRLERGAHATLFEHHVDLVAAPNLTNLVWQVELAEQASLDHVRLQQLDLEGFLVSRSDLNLLQQSQYHSWSFDLGGRLARHDTNVSLNGEGAACALEGVFALDGRHHVDHHTRVDHIAPNTTSTEVFKGVLDGSSRGVFNGKVVVHPGADGTDARQSNANLLLSDKSEIDTKPELEIYADDVKCAHGATVGELDANQLFYLRSRGIPESLARSLLIQAFCSEVIDQIKVDALRDFVNQQFELKLPQWQSAQAER